MSGSITFGSVIFGSIIYDKNGVSVSILFYISFPNIQFVIVSKGKYHKYNYKGEYIIQRESQGSHKSLLSLITKADYVEHYKCGKKIPHLKALMGVVIVA